MEQRNSMSKKYFPIFIDLSEKKVVVIGGGTIATRRIHTLLSFVGKITVVAPEITEELQQLQRQGNIEWVQELYHVSWLERADMVIAATNQPTVNQQVKSDCQRIEKESGRHILVSVIDDRELCDFYFPSIVQSEDIVIGINTGGKPALTKQIRKEIEEYLKCKSIYECWNL